MHYQDFILNAGAIAGYVIIFALVFAESGVFFGFFLPGDSLLFGLGIAASQGYPNIYLLMLAALAGAILGVTAGYFFGHKVGPSLFKKKESLFFKQEYLDKAQEFYKHHGRKTIVLARFTPVVRTFAPIVAGMGKMHYGTFLAFNILGGIGWVGSMTLLGYFLGNVVPNIDHYVFPILAVIIILSFGLGFQQLRATANK